MKLYITFSWDHPYDVLWIYGPGKFGPLIPPGDTYRIKLIDVGDLVKLMAIAEKCEWSAYGLDTEEFVILISAALRRVQETMPDTFSEEPVFACPEPLAEALGISIEPIPIGEWLDNYPPPPPPPEVFPESLE